MGKHRKKNDDGEANPDLVLAGEALFRERWNVLAGLGICEAIGGQEYKRVLAEWQVAGEPVHLDQFIREYAIRPTPKKGGKDHGEQ